MRPNLLRERLSGGQIATMVSSSSGSAYCAEILGHTGFDAVLVDMQHGALDDATQLQCLTAISATQAVPIVRVRWNDPGAIMRALDAGAYGIVCPMVNSRKDCESFVQACYYHPAGQRSWGPMRALLYGGPDYFAKANATVMPIAMIETEEALAAVEEIAAVPGLAGLLVGPSDLSISLGLSPVPNLHQGPLPEAYLRIVAAARRHAIPVASYCANARDAHTVAALGVTIAWIGSDAVFVRAGASHTLEEFNHKEKAA
jgi:4-hydroxy-2-oxoheptanedioate aldolase